MMQADLTELLVVSRLIPRLIWSVSATRPVVIARDENLLRLYWMPVLLRIDDVRAQLFIDELNAAGQR